MSKVNLLSPCGRIVSGHPYEPKDKDYKGNPLLTKDKKPRLVYSVGIAIPKATPTWQETEWGRVIVEVAHTAFPTLFDPSGNVLPGRSFAWKVIDGDSTDYNSVGKRPCDYEAWPGHWVMQWSNGFPPSYYNNDGSMKLTEEVIKRGHWVQIYGTVCGNDDSGNPGVYLNWQAMSHQAIDEELSFAVEASAIGFGASGGLPSHVQRVSSTDNTGPFQGTTPAPTMPTATPAPATDLVQPMAPPPAPTQSKRYIVNDNVFTAEQLLATPGWTQEHLATLQEA